MQLARRRLGLAVVVAIAVGVAAPASADITAFLGASTSPSTRQARGFALGTGFLVVGFEFEYAEVVEDLGDLAPGLRVGSVNGLLQTPIPVAGTQFYVTAGGGVYRERLGPASETNLAVNVGGGAKIRLLGPLRLRLDYRLISLRGDPLHDRSHRIYAGANIGF
ncbi:MAG TPA: hypothetical protein VK911_14525 [Vicinamibacterales bacterium]|nr:hypothetical protein [Vicinamibacterales bacterium]